MRNLISPVSGNRFQNWWTLLLISPSAFSVVLVLASPGAAVVRSLSGTPSGSTSPIAMPDPERVTRSVPAAPIVESDSNRAGQAMTVPAIPLQSQPTVGSAIAAPEVLPPEAARVNAVLSKQPYTIARVTSVSGLSDVQPTDWAFQALQALVERYGVIEGYPDGTFRGNRAMTRYEFAAGLNAALNRVNELIQSGLGDRVSRADLETLDRLQKEFSKELTTLRGRVDGLEARTGRLEAFNFSNTTKLTGQAIFALNTGFQDQDGVRDPNTILFSRVRLNFNTSFTGRDRLLTQLQAQTSSPVLRASGSPGVATDAAAYLVDDASGLFYSPTTGIGFQLTRLQYSFPVTKNLNVTIFPRGFASDYVDYLTYANKQFDNADNFSTTSLTSNILLFARDFTSSGAAAVWNPGGGAFTFRAVYAAQDATVPNPTGLTTLPTGLGSISDAYGNPAGDRRGGLFGDPYVGIVEAEYSPSRAFAVRVQYAGGEVGGRKYSAVGGNAEYAFSKNLAVFGRFGYSPNFFPRSFFGDEKPTYWQVGVAFPNLFVPNALAGISIAQPLIIHSTFAQPNVTGTQTNYEVFYNYPVSPNIRVTPLLQVITDPLNNANRGAVFTGTVRTVISF